MAEESQGEEEDYKEAAHSTADYADYKSPQKRRNPRWARLGKSAVIVIVILVLAGVGYELAKHHKSTKKPTQAAQTTQNAPTSSPSKIATATKHYDSPNFNLGFDYPANWTVTDTGGGHLTVKSPTVSLKNASGQTVSGQVTMTVRQTNQKLPEFDAGGAVAALDSEKIAYTTPTQSQRGNTYISFLRYAGSNSGYDGIYITSDNGYKKAQEIPKADIQKVDPIINVTFTSSDKALSLATSSWDDGDFSTPLKSMLESFSIN